MSSRALLPTEGPVTGAPEIVGALEALAGRDAEDDSVNAPAQSSRDCLHTSDREHRLGDEARAVGAWARMRDMTTSKKPKVFFEFPGAYDVAF